MANTALRNFGHKVWGWFYENSNQIALVSTTILGIVDISNINDWKIETKNDIFYTGQIIYISSVIVAIFAGILSVDKNKITVLLENELNNSLNKISDLENSLDERVSAMNNLFESYLALITNNLEFDHTGRISVYKVQKETFILIGRSSTNPRLKRKNRNNYPLTEGFISKAWEEGIFFVDNLPDPTGKNFTKYFREVSAIMPIPEETVSKISMKSRTYLIYRINGLNGEPKAIFVAESEVDKAFDKQVVIDKIKAVEQALVLFIETNNGTVTEVNRIGL